MYVCVFKVVSSYYNIAVFFYPDKLLARTNREWQPVRYPQEPLDVIYFLRKIYITLPTNTQYQTPRDDSAAERFARYGMSYSDTRSAKHRNHEWCLDTHLACRGGVDTGSNFYNPHFPRRDGSKLRVKIR